MQHTVLEHVEGFYQIIQLARFRETPGVRFDVLQGGLLPRVDGIDRVIHEREALSPGPVGEVVRPWYMHTHQDDNLMVLHGLRNVDLFDQRTRALRSFVVTPDEVRVLEGACYRGAVMLVWPRGVFHRIQSGAQGSASINLATRYEGLDPRHNFSIFSLDVSTGRFEVIREGHLDQFAPD